MTPKQRTRGHHAVLYEAPNGRVSWTLWPTRKAALADATTIARIWPAVTPKPIVFPVVPWPVRTRAKK
jgi:hypothetical protein